MMSRAKNTTNENGTVVGLFPNQADAERAIERLKQEGFSQDQIGVALRDRSKQEQLIEGTGTQAAEGAAAGALSGGILGGVLGLLAGVGALAIPGIGPIIAGGTLASTLAGAGIGAATGGLLGALVGMGIPEEDARHFDEGFRAGGTLVTVDARGRAEEARECLYESGADLGSLGRGLSSEKMSTGVSTAERPAGTAEEARIQLREEELRAETERREEARIEQTGDTRVRGETDSWRGNERRYRHDSSYSGPERRLAGI
jgi:hypothetical protein